MFVTRDSSSLPSRIRVLGLLLSLVVDDVGMLAQMPNQAVSSY